MNNTQTPEERYEAFKALLEYLTSEEDEVKSWEDHEEVVESATESERVDDVLNDTSLVDKLGIVMHMVTNQVIRGEILVESGSELLDMSKAVVLREQLRAAVEE